MKTRSIIVALMLICISTGFAQFRQTGVSKPKMTESITNENANLLFGFIDPNKFSMSHSFNASYISGGGAGIAVTSYTNSMRYTVADNLNLRVDASLMHSPYNSLGANMQDFSGLYISRAELNYQPFDNVNVTIQYRNVPFSMFNNGYGGYYGSGLGSLGFMEQ